MSFSEHVRQVPGLNVHNATEHRPKQETVQADEDDKNDDNQSTKSSDSASSTSTIRYSQEPWNTFKDKVTQLATQLFPDVKDIDIERLPGGSSNRVVGISVAQASHHYSFLNHAYDFIRTICGHPAVTQKMKTDRYILRIPRYGDEHMERDIAVLKLIGCQKQYPVPRVIRHDMTEDNALGAPYTLQHRIPGQTLHTIFGQLNHEQRKDLTRKIVRLMMFLQTMLVSACAVVTAYEPFEQGHAFRMEILSIPTEHDEDESPTVLLAKPQTTLEFILDACQRWQDYEKSYLCKPRPFWDEFMAMAREMHKRDLIPDTDKFHFTHMDLYARNILVNVKDENSIEITGVLDWDDALYAPKYVACRAPFWLWEDEEGLDENCENEALRIPEETGSRELKELFEQIVGSDFLRYAYGPEYILLRRMFVQLQYGVSDNAHSRECRTILEEWSRLRDKH
ncbi:hypothetical protein P153DRAFT_414785 [Dothidotthia symphoricarpi CBS 119687]|uniref:Aminoglycoside phosphotransferase domain-containing protein n=1 Tax=Dothidotthia symphoricarpi CBS 119687 TaxID=1392245 RepID=A0A6A6AMS8_9PLEO|nr:uncharacterized protein P153DRAFT_414785 [Dothidotthia symphoricarpi CBS 119687]KAF2132866.1 hypothetical protein P153DRAFT_414785 [Dothidotthia symphoricarpi CBS 119687]